MQFGVARRDITPPEGIDLSGFISREGPCVGTHDPLFATALVAGWTNDNLGYLSAATAFPIGGYEMDTAARYYGFPAPWAPEAGAAVTAEAIDLVQRLYSENASLE